MTYWRDDRRHYYNWKRRQGAPLPPHLVAFLEKCTDWTSFEDLAAGLGVERGASVLSDVIDHLLRLGLLESSEPSLREHPWDQWHPDAALFHFGTKDQNFETDPFARDAALRQKALSHPQPAPTTRRAGEIVTLPSSLPTGLDPALDGRRTWRRFSPAPLPLVALATVLERTFAVQVWADVDGQGAVGLKTSPSAGARTPIEAYVLALSVEGLAPGAYHYDAADRHLVNLRRPVSRDFIVEVLANQHYYRGAAAIVVMSAVFERVMWRYPFGRAYRMVLLDAGHLAQTFCLTATSLELAPFCTMAFSESKLEQLLGLDGVMESPMYVVGVGMPTPDRQQPGGADPAASEH